MTARERAEALWASVDGECEPGCSDCEASVAAIADCIADAEAAAYERAAKECEALVSLTSLEERQTAYMIAAITLRALATQGDER
jgi:hypothetical protein